MNKKGFDKGWIAVNSSWASKTKTKGPSLKMWWIVVNTKYKKRWLIKNLKSFAFKAFEKENSNTRSQLFWKNDRDYFYNELARYGRTYSYWRCYKPTRHDYLYNLLGTRDLKIFKGTFEKEIPYDDKELQVLMETGHSQEVKQFWGNIDFTL